MNEIKPMLKCLGTVTMHWFWENYGLRQEYNNDLAFMVTTKPCLQRPEWGLERYKWSSNF